MPKHNDEVEEQDLVDVNALATVFFVAVLAMLLQFTAQWSTGSEC
jgi:hypothetical protein